MAESLLPSSAGTNASQDKDAAQRRRSLISQIEQRRSSRVITYFLSDRQGAQAQISEDAVRPLYDHLLALAADGPVGKVDLFLYSIGGVTEVPWRIVTMIREFTDEFGVLVPYKAMSAATMIAIGADEVYMGKKGELGPIDPQYVVQRTGDGPDQTQQMISVEDVMSYVRFLRDKAGLSDQSALSGPVTALADKMNPQVLGQINRIHSHIRSVARKLLTARGGKFHPIDEQKTQLIIDTLAERTYQHGHAIGRREAQEIGLNIATPEPDLDNLIWQLFESYEGLCELRVPLEYQAILQKADPFEQYVTLGCIESVALAHQNRPLLHVKATRQSVPLTLNVSLQLPPNVQVGSLPQNAQLVLQQLLAQAQKDIHQLVVQEVKNQMPVVGVTGWLEDARWVRLADWP